MSVHTVDCLAAGIDGNATSSDPRLPRYQALKWNMANRRLFTFSALMIGKAVNGI